MVCRTTHDLDRRQLDYPRGRHSRTCSRWLSRSESSVKALCVYINTHYLFFPEQPIDDMPNVRVDLTRNGYHMISHIPGQPQYRACLLREILGDDERRLDRTQRGRPIFIDNIMSGTKLGGRQYVIRGIRLI